MPYLLFTLIISIIVAVFAVQNAVTYGWFLMWTVQTSLVVVILGSCAFGCAGHGLFYADAESQALFV